jgi:hypothetical protein
MRSFPHLNVARIAQVPNGELVLLIGHNPPSVAITGYTNEFGGDKILLLFSTDLLNKKGPLIIDSRNQTVISFGTDFAIRLPVEPELWSADPPTDDIPCVAVMQDKVFLRGNNGRHSHEFWPCWIELSSGILSRSPLQGIVAYALAYDIVIQDGSTTERLVLRTNRT